MGREVSNGTVGRDPSMPRSPQIGKMPSLEPEIGSSSPISSAGDTIVKLSTTSLQTELQPMEIIETAKFIAVVPVADEYLMRDVDEEAEVADTVPDVLNYVMPAHGHELTGIGSNYKPERNAETRRPSLVGQALLNEGIVKKTTKLSAFENVSQELADDKKTLKEITLGRRVGFYRIRTDLGSGNFAQVKLAIHALTREKVAVKIMDKARLDQKTQRLVAREIANMERVHHPNIIRLYEVMETLAKLYLVMEYAGGGELFTKITNEGRMKEDDAVPLLAQVIAALDHLHSLDIIHRDLKAENVFFSGPNTIKVGDFGFSTISLSMAPLNTFCGSPPYAAPELLRDQSYEGRPVDIWALGIMMYFMVTGMLPFRGESVRKLKRAIIKGVYTVPNYLSPPCVELITALLQPLVPDRPNTQGLRRFKWLNRAIYPDPLKAYTQNPDDIFFADALPDDERQARKVLTELGITREVIQKVNGKQSRSSITGTYRIVLHRIQKQALGVQHDEFPNAMDGETGLHTVTSLPIPRTTIMDQYGRKKNHISPLSPFFPTLRGFPGFNTTDRQTSRMCVIL